MERILLLDYARIGAALLVVFGHLYDPSPDEVLRTFIYQFHMPLFFFISGMLHRPKSMTSLARRLLWPVVVFYGFYHLLCYLLYHYGLWEGTYAVYQNGFTTFFCAVFADMGRCFVHSKGLGPSWFLIALFYVKVLCMIAAYSARRCGVFLRNGRSIVYLESLFLTALCGLCWFVGYRYGLSHGYGGWRNVCYLGNALMAVPYYVSGRCVIGILPAVNAWFACHRSVALGLAVALAGIVSAAVHYNGGVSMFCILFGRQPFPLNILWCYVSGFCGTLMVLLFATSLPRCPQGLAASCVRLGAASLIGVVGFQYFFCEVVRHTLGLGQPYLVGLMLSLIIYSVCVLLWSLFHRLGIL